MAPHAAFCHPLAVSRAETLAHLTEIGDPVLAILETAKNERILETTCDDLARLISPPTSNTVAPRPWAPEDPRARMLARFAFVVSTFTGARVNENVVP